MPSMPKWKSGDRVRVVERAVTKEDRATNSYFSHLAGLTGTVQNFYNKDEVAVCVDQESFAPMVASTHKEAVKRMRAKFLDSLSEEQRRKLSREERQFDANYVVLVHSDDLEKGPPAPKRAAKVEEDEEDLDSFDPTSVKQGVLYDDPAVPTSAPKRKSIEEIEAEEEAELNKRLN